MWRERFVRAVAAAGGGRVHVKLDIGHGPAGHARPRPRPTRVADAVARDARASSWSGLMTHFATADELDDGGFFARAARALRALGAAR